MSLIVTLQFELRCIWQHFFHQPQYRITLIVANFQHNQTARLAVIGQLWQQASDQVKPARPCHQCVRRLIVAHLGRQRAVVAVGDIRKVSDDHVDAFGSNASKSL